MTNEPRPMSVSATLLAAGLTLAWPIVLGVVGGVAGVGAEASWQVKRQALPSARTLDLPGHGLETAWLFSEHTQAPLTKTAIP
jgi:hypothetical protein